MVDLQPNLAETGSYLFHQKRIFDVGFSVLVLLLVLPLMLVIALAIKLGSRGPIFFVRDRVGLNRRVFRMFKFRTMNAGSEEEGDTHVGPATMTRGGRQREHSYARQTWMNFRNSLTCCRAT
jgi:lipopolysaccharide/colanic/teichoic acid biosynthesis glycosyltransferase